MAFIEVRDLAKSFPAAKGTRHVLKGVSLDVEHGEFVSIVGAMGSGKSTLLSLIAGLTTADSGSVSIGGETTRGVRRDAAFVFQNYSLLPWFTALENVRLAVDATFPEMTRDEQRRHATRALEQVGLGNAIDRRPRQLSGGMRQRVALARLMANEPEVLLMDEPLAALDAQTRLILQDELLRIWGQDRPATERRTVVFITHAIDEAVFLADRVAVMTTHPGRLKAVIDVDLARPRGDATRALPQFQSLCQHIWSLIRDEAYRATVT